MCISGERDYPPHLMRSRDGYSDEPIRRVVGAAERSSQSPDAPLQAPKKTVSLSPCRRTSKRQTAPFAPLRRQNKSVCRDPQNGAAPLAGNSHPNWSRQLGGDKRTPSAGRSTFRSALPGRYCRCWLLSKLPQVRPAPRAPDPEGFRRHGHAPGSRSKSQDSQQLQACCQSGEVLPIRRKDHPARRKIRSIRKRSVETDCEPAGFAAAGSMRCCNEHIHLLKDRAGSAKEFATRQRRPYTTARSSKHGPSGCALQVGECSG